MKIRIGKVLPDITAALTRAEHMISELRKEGGYDDPGLNMLVKDETQRRSYFCRSSHAAIRSRTALLPSLSRSEATDTRAGSGSA